MPNYPVVATNPRGAGRRRKNGFSKAQSLVMTQIAKKVVQKEAETKSALYIYDQTCFDDLLYASNLTYFIAQGAGVQQRVGQKIHLKNFYIKGKLTSVNSAVVGNGTTIFRIMIIKSDQELTTTNATLTKGDVFRGSTNTLTARGFPDLSKVSVIYDKTHTLTSDIANANEHRVFTINKKINKKVIFNADTTSYLKGEQYYFLVTAGKTDGSAATCGFLNCQIAINFKDE